MKSIRFLTVAGTTACMLLALSSEARSEMSNGGIVSASTAQSASSSATATRRADRTLSKRIIKTLAVTKGVDATHVFVKSVAGNVILSGTVTDSAQIPIIVQVTQQVEGVKTVRNGLRLQNQSD